MVKSLIDPKKAKEVRDALKKGDFAGVFGKKKELEKPAPAVEPLNANPLSKEQPTLNMRLLDTARDGDKEGVERLLVGGAHADAKDTEGWTALSLAAFHGHREVAELLVKIADVNSIDNNGDTALFWAADQGHREIVELLIANGANVNAQNLGWQTALYWAKLAKHEAIVELLIAKGAKDNLVGLVSMEAHMRHLDKMDAEKFRNARERE